MHEQRNHNATTSQVHVIKTPNFSFSDFVYLKKLDRSKKSEISTHH